MTESSAKGGQVNRHTYMEPTVIFEDSDVLVLDKPAGLNVHGDGRTVEATLSEWILKNYPELKDVGEPFELKPNPKNIPLILRPGIVHRLDRDTSGVIVVAKTPEAFMYLKTAFKEHQVKKEYLALVYGHLDLDSGIIDTPIGKSKRDFRQREAGPMAGGVLREARTVWEVKQRLVDNAGHNYTLVHVRPETGRTHQIRAHMKSIGHAVACDSLYAHGRLCPPPLARHALHAARLTLTLPSGESKTFESPLPTDFTAALEQLGPI